MPRLLLIAALFIQLLMAQAAVADVSCEHTLPGHSSPESSAVVDHTAHVHSQASPSDEQSLCNCACDVAGHCSSTVVGSVMRAAGTDLSLHSDKPATATDAITSGYRTHPYRPPSAAA